MKGMRSASMLARSGELH